MGINCTWHCQYMRPRHTGNLQMDECPLSMLFSLKSTDRAWEYGLHVPETRVLHPEKSVIVSNTIYKSVLGAKYTEAFGFYCMLRLQHFGKLVTHLLWGESHILRAKKHSFGSRWWGYLAEILSTWTVTMKKKNTASYGAWVLKKWKQIKHCDREL